jgi:hypothetical protein
MKVRQTDQCYFPALSLADAFNLLIAYSMELIGLLNRLIPEHPYIFLERELINARMEQG